MSDKNIIPDNWNSPPLSPDSTNQCTRMNTAILTNNGGRIENNWPIMREKTAFTQFDC